MTTLNRVAFNAAEQQADIVACHALVELFAEISTPVTVVLTVSFMPTISIFANLHDTTLDASGSNRTTSGDREDVFYRHEESLSISRAGSAMSVSIAFIRLLIASTPVFRQGQQLLNRERW